MQLILPIEFEVPTFRIINEERMDESDSLQERLLTLTHLDEDKHLALIETKKIQNKRKKYFDQSIKEIKIQEGDHVLLYDNRHMNFLEKLHTCWMGSYKVIENFANL